MSKTEQLADLFKDVKRGRRSNGREDVLSNVDVLREMATTASSVAQQNAKDMGIPYVIGRNSQIIKVHPDGREEVIRDNSL